ncbi:MAG: hypothetical protein AAF250_05650 [Pseudomonadota bacterium]
MRSALILIATLALSACAGGSGAGPVQRSAASAPQPSPSQSGGAFRPPDVQNARGLDGVIGARAATLTQRFGTARIDLTEGDARKLQFSGRTCVLDIFLYPLQAGQEPVATHVDARLRNGGGDVDERQCIEEVARAN